jgi:hypothetical protein
MPVEPRGIYRERKGGAIKTAPASNTTNIKNSTWQKIVTARVAISRRLINFHGKTTAPTTIPRSHLAGAVGYRRCRA